MVVSSKKIILSLILSLITVFLLSFLWLLIVPVNLSFSLDGTKVDKLKVSAFAANDKNFKQFEIFKKTFSLNESKKLVFSFKKIFSPKYFKFSFRGADDLILLHKNTIVVSNVMLKQGDIRINNFNDFEIKGADYKIVDNKILLYPTAEDIELIYKKKLNVKSSVYFDIYMFIIIFIISFLFFYKLTDCFLEFKPIKGNSIIDIIFLVIFFVFLFMPMMHIDTSEKSELENRLLAKMEPFANSRGKINYKFFNSVSKYFNDRFFLRPIFVKSDIVIRCFINQNYCSNKSITYYKKGDLLYRKNYWGLNVIGPKEEKYKNRILRTDAKNLNHFKKYCDKNNIKLYLLIVPRQAEFFDYELKERLVNKKDRGLKVIKYLKKNTNIKIIYPLEEMKQANNDTPVYFKTDHHWTKKGAYVGYSALMSSIKQDFPNVKILQESSLIPYYDTRVLQLWKGEFHNGQGYRDLLLPNSYSKKILNTKYLYYKNPYEKSLKEGNFSNLKKDRYDAEFYYPDGYPAKVMLIADSFGSNLCDFLPYSFKHMLYLYNNRRKFQFDEYKYAIEKYKPNIIVIEFFTHNLNMFLNLYPNQYSIKEE